MRTEDMEVQQFKVFMAPEAGESVNETLHSGFIGEGSKVKEFEDTLKNYLDAPHLLAVNSGTSALHLALQVAKMQTTRRKVITSPLTCFATTAAILQAGLEPVWCDVDPKTCNISVDAIEHLLDRDLEYCAIVVVHYGGYPVDMKHIHQILNDKYKDPYCHRVEVIEDCAHSLGARTPDGMVGAGQFGNQCCHSFQAIKTLTTGDGGAIVVRPRDYELVKRLRWFGLNRDVDRMVQDIPVSGYKHQMNNLAATIGLANFKYLNTLVCRQMDNIRWYSKAIHEFAPCYRRDFQSSGWMFPVIVGNAIDFDRAMKDRGVHTGLTHKRNDDYSCVKMFKRGPLAGVDKAEMTVSCIPSGWWVGDEEREYIVDCMKRGW